MLEVNRLRALHALAKFGSVNAAAAALHCTPSAISQQLAKLERETGTVLSEKDGRGLRLTDAGRLLARSAVTILDQIEQAEAALAAHHETVTGRLVIASFATACRALLPHALSTLHTDYPRLNTALLELNPYEATAALAKGEADVAVVDDWPEVGLRLPEGTSSRELGLDVADLIVPAGHALTANTSVTLEAARPQRWIASPPGTICHDWLMRVLPGVQPDYYVGEFETQLTLIAAGLGIALVPRLARTGLPEGVVALAVSPTPTRRVMAVWRTSSAARPAVLAAVEAFEAAWQAVTRQIER
jgi:DNA-binding transcriptional LysR family regulator